MRHVALPGRGPSQASSLGYTVLELVVVVSIVAVLAAVALPGLNPSQDEKLDLAASRVAEALRLARTEAIRTGEPHAAEIIFDTEQVIVSKPDMTLDSPYPSGTPTNPAWLLIDPISKQPFDQNLTQEGPTRGVDVLVRPFTYAIGDRRTVIFDNQGMPFFKAAGAFYQLEDGLTRLSFGGRELGVRVAPITGRVTIE